MQYVYERKVFHILFDRKHNYIMTSKLYDNMKILYLYIIHQFWAISESEYPRNASYKLADFMDLGK